MLRRDYMVRRLSRPWQRPAWLPMLLVLALAAACENGDAQVRKGGGMAKLALNDPRMEDWLARALGAPVDRFREVGPVATLLFRPLQESKGVLGMLLADAANPHVAVAVARWTALAADPGGLDLLRVEYAAAGLRMELTQSRNFVVVRVTDAGDDLARAPDRRAYVAAVVARVVKTESQLHRWRFELPVDLAASEEPRVISNSGAPALAQVQSRHDRADILVSDRFLAFVFYNRIEQLEDYPPPDQWFGPEARAALKAAAR